MDQIIKETKVGNRIVRTCKRDAPMPFYTDTLRRNVSVTGGVTLNCTQEKAEQDHQTAVEIATVCLLLERREKRPSLRRERELANKLEQLRKQYQELENEVSMLRDQKGQLPGHYIRIARRAVIGIILRGDSITDENLSLIRQGIHLQEILHIARALVSRSQKRKC